MTEEVNAQDQDEILKTDVLGRVRVPREKREELLDAFEASGMSGQAFAEQHGVHVQTFASWIQKRRRARGDYDHADTRRKLRMRKNKQKSEQGSSEGALMNLIEVQVGSHDKDETPALEIALPGGAVVRVSSESQFALLKSLLREFAC